MSRYSPSAFVALVLLSTGCSRAATSNPTPAAAVATLRDAGGRTVGSASIGPASTGGVRLQVTVNGLAPGAHGIHVHAVGACDGSTPTAFSSAGGHFNPTSKQHGRLNPSGWHVGDLPNLVVDTSGNGSADIVVESLTLDSGAAALLDADGSALVIHANPDDERTDAGSAGPGNSGARIACGVIGRR